MLGLGSNTQLGIGIAIKLYDQFSGTANRINQQLMNMRKNSQTALVGAMQTYRNQAGVIAGGAALITKGMYDMATSGAKFQHTINQTAIVGGKNLGQTRKQLSAFATDMANNFRMDPTDVANVMFENTKAGLSKGMDEVIKYQIATAKATDEALAGEEGVGNKLLGILNSMGLKATDQIEIAGKKMSQFARVANATTAASNATMASVYSIGESMEYFSNSGAVAGMTLEQMLALTGKLSQSNIKGSSAGTALNNMTQQLINSLGQFATPKKQKAWAALGINPDQIKGMVDSGNIYDALKIIDSSARKMGRTDKLTTLNTLFNMRGQRGMVNAFMGGEKSLGDIEKEIKQGIANDVSVKQSKAMINDLYGDMAGLHTVWQSFKNAFTEAIAPALRVFLGILTRVVTFLGHIVNTPVGRVFATLAAIVIPLVGVMFGFRMAVMGAILALRSFGIAGGVGGFSALTRGGLGMLGGSMYGGVASQVGKNSAGRLYVRGGQSVNYGGKMYKGGQILPKAFMAAGLTSGASSMAGLFSGGGKIAGFLGKITPWIGRIVGFGARWIPVVGWIWTAVELVKGIVDFLGDDESKNLDRNTLQYLHDLDSQFFGFNQSNSWYNKTGRSKAHDTGQIANSPYNQTINLNVDGKQAMSKTLQNDLNSNMNNQFDFEIPGN